jgi:putative tricarboxylic transport membrane protein
MHKEVEMVRPLRDGTVLFGAGLFLLGIYMLASSLRWGVYGPEGPGPGFFPLIYGLVTVIFSSILVFQAIEARRQAPRAKPTDRSEEADSIPAVVAAVALMASVPLMYFLGFVIGFGFALFFLIRIVFERPTIASVMIAAGVVLGLYLGFSVLMGLPLPVGKFWSF